MTVRYHTIATSQGGLDSVMSLPPDHVRTIPPEEHFTASGYRKLLGSRGIEFLWKLVDAVDWDDICDRTGGSSATSIYGWVRTKDWITRHATTESWSDYRAYIDQPIDGEWYVGDIRYNIMVRCRRLVKVTELVA